jgi:hypothetical protein
LLAREATSDAPRLFWNISMTYRAAVLMEQEAARGRNQ